MAEDLKFKLGLDSSKYREGLKKAETEGRKFSSKTKEGLKKLQSEYKTLTVAQVKTRATLQSLAAQGKKNTAEYKAHQVALKKVNQRLKQKKSEVLKTADALKKNEQALKKNEQAQKKLADQIRKSNEQKKKQAGLLSKIKGGYLALAGALISVGIAVRKISQLIVQSTDKFISYETALQEVNTLYSGAGGLTDSTKEFIRQQSLLFGKSQQQNLKAYYQIVSAGITDQLKANKVLEQANKAAIAGVTDLFTAVDGLTSALNAYKDENLTAKQAADSMFSAVKLGKTTFGELSSSMGQVLTLAQSAGITFQEVMASATQLTLRGLSTAEAFTQLKGVIRTFLKPSSEAVDLMQELGLELDANNIRSKGFAEVMREISEAVDGDEKKLAVLFGRIQGLTGAMALSSKGAKAFAGYVRQIGEGAGATDTALEKMSGTLKLKLERSTEKFNDKMIEAGKNLQNFRISASNLKNTLASLWLTMAKGINWIAESDGIWAKLNRTLLKSNMIYGAYIGLKKALGVDKEAETISAQADIDTAIREDFKGKKPKGTKSQSTKAKVQDTLRITIKAGEDAVRSLYDTAIQKAQEGIRQIREATEKAIYQLRALYFGGGGFSSLGQAFKSLQGNDQARSAFTSFTGRVDQKSLSPTGIGSLANASLSFSKLDQEGKDAVNSIIEKMKQLKGLVEATDIEGVVKAVMQGFRVSGLGGNLLDIAKGSFRVNERDIRQKGADKEQELIAKTLREVAPKMKEAVDEFKDASTEIKDAISRFKDSILNDLPLVLGNFRHDLSGGRNQTSSVLDEQKISRDIQNETSALSNRSVQGGI